MSHEVTQKGSLVWESPLFEGNPDLVSLKLEVLQALISWKGTRGVPKERLESTRATANVGDLPVGLDGQGGKAWSPAMRMIGRLSKFAAHIFDSGWNSGIRKTYSIYIVWFVEWIRKTFSNHMWFQTFQNMMDTFSNKGVQWIQPKDFDAGYKQFEVSWRWPWGWPYCLWQHFAYSILLVADV